MSCYSLINVALVAFGIAKPIAVSKMRPTTRIALFTRGTVVVVIVVFFLITVIEFVALVAVTAVEFLVVSIEFAVALIVHG